MKNCFFLFFLFTSFSLRAQTTAENSFPPLEPLFKISQKDSLSPEDIIRTSLEFSLCPENSEEGREILNQFKILEEKTTSQEFLSLSEEARGEKILSFMYENVLRQYSLNQTYINTMFKKGTYNCVSASILYYALAKSAGLKVVGNETPDHAFCSIYLSDSGNKKIDVETTNPNGFNPGTKKNLPSTGNSKRYYLVPKKFYNNRKEISEWKFVTLVGKNVTAYLDEKRDYNHSVPVSATRLDFINNSPQSVGEDERKSVRQDFDTAITNYAVSLDRQKKSDSALDWLDLVENRWGKAENQNLIQKTYDNFLYNSVVNSIRAEKSEEARQKFNSRSEKISSRRKEEIKNIIFIASIDEKTKNMRAEEAIDFLHSQKDLEEAGSKEARKKLFDLEEYYWAERAKPLSKAGNFLEAAKIIDEGLKNLPSSKNLQTIKNQNLNNYAVGVHNQFVDSFNKKDFEHAEKILNDGLQNLPRNGILQKDSKTLQNRKKK